MIIFKSTDGIRCYVDSDKLYSDESGDIILAKDIYLGAAYDFTKERIVDSDGNVIAFFDAEKKEVLDVKYGSPGSVIGSITGDYTIEFYDDSAKIISGHSFDDRNLAMAIVGYTMFYHVLVGAEESQSLDYYSHSDSNFDQISSECPHVSNSNIFIESITGMSSEQFRQQIHDDVIRGTKLEQLEIKAKNGDPDAQFELADAYECGTYGLKKSMTDAIYWYIKSAEGGNSSAMNNLADSYGKGLGVPKDIEKAMYWYIKAAETGDPYQQVILADIYVTGRYCKKSIEKAKYWYREAAINGLAEGIEKCKKYGVRYD